MPGLDREQRAADPLDHRPVVAAAPLAGDVVQVLEVGDQVVAVLALLDALGEVVAERRRRTRGRGRASGTAPARTRSTRATGRRSCRAGRARCPRPRPRGPAPGCVGGEAPRVQAAHGVADDDRRAVVQERGGVGDEVLGAPAAAAVRAAAVPAGVEPDDPAVPGRATARPATRCVARPIRPCSSRIGRPLPPNSITRVVTTRDHIPSPTASRHVSQDGRGHRRRELFTMRHRTAVRAACLALAAVEPRRVHVAGGLDAARAAGADAAGRRRRRARTAPATRTTRRTATAATTSPRYHVRSATTRRAAARRRHRRSPRRPPTT